MVYESWATYVNRLFEDYSCGKHICQERDSDKVEPQHRHQLPLCLGRYLTWSFERMKKEQNEKGAKNSWSSCWLNGYSYIPSAHNMVESIRIDFACRLKLFLHLIAAAGNAQWKCRCCFTHTEVKPTLTSTSHFPLFSLPPSALKHLPTCPPTRFAATRCCSTNPPAKQQQRHHHINMHLPDKWSTLSVFSRQIRSHPLAVSQPFDWSVCLHISQRLNRMPSVLGKLQARRSGSRDLEGIGKTQLNGRSCLCLTLPT